MTMKRYVAAAVCAVGAAAAGVRHLNVDADGVPMPLS